MAEPRKPPKGCYWRGKTLWGRFEVKGVEYRRSLRTGEAKLAAARLVAEREKVIADQHFGETRPSWKDAFVSWSSAIKAHTKASTYARYNTSLTQLEPYLKDLYLDQIDKAVVNDIVRRRRAAGVTNATIRRDLTAMSSVLDHAEEEGMSEGNPALAKSRRLKERRDPIVLPELDSIAAVIAHAGERFAPMIRAALLTGCRLEELAGMARRQVDHNRGQVTLTKTKGNRVRVIDMRDAREVFTSQPRATTTESVFWHGPDTVEEPASRYASPSTNFRRVVASAQKAAQREAKARKAESTFRPFRFHDLRHRFAVDALRSGMGIYDLQQHLGHSSVAVTEIYLAFLTAEEQAEARKGSAQVPAHRP